MKIRCERVHLDSGEDNSAVGVLQARHDALHDAFCILGLADLHLGDGIQDVHLHQKTTASPEPCKR